MKKIICFILLIIPSAVWAQEQKFILNAKIGHDNAPAKAYLDYKSPGGKDMFDSVMIKNGGFQFNGLVSLPVHARLTIDHQDIGYDNLGPGTDILFLYLEPGGINLTAPDSVKNALITGSKMNIDDRKLKLLLDSVGSASGKLYQQIRIVDAQPAKDSLLVEKLNNELAVISKRKVDIQKQFIKDNPGSYLSLLQLIDITYDDLDVAAIEPLYLHLATKIRNTSTGKDYAKSIEAARHTQIGAMAPLFIQPDMSGKQIALSSFRGKYVLLDFWASWCVPCRAETPYVKKAYDKYKSRNFTVVSVSLDNTTQKNDWLNAVKTDKMDWTQLADLMGWKNAAAQAYGIREIPQNVLIDPTGKIIAKNLRGNDLAKKLASIFN